MEYIRASSTFQTKTLEHFKQILIEYFKQILIKHFKQILIEHFKQILMEYIEQLIQILMEYFEACLQVVLVSLISSLPIKVPPVYQLKMQNDMHAEVISYNQFINI